MSVSTDTEWSDDYADSTSEAYITLSNSIKAATISAFSSNQNSESRVSDLKLVDVIVSFAQSASARRKKRSTSTVDAIVTLVFAFDENTSDDISADQVLAHVEDTVETYKSSFDSVGVTVQVETLKVSAGIKNTCGIFVLFLAGIFFF